MKEIESILLSCIPLAKEYIEAKKSNIRMICLTVAYVATLGFAVYFMRV